MADTSPKKRLKPLPETSPKRKAKDMDLPSFVAEAKATPKDAQELAKERLDKLTKNLFCAMATHVKQNYVGPKHLMQFQFPHTCPPSVFTLVFRQAKEWMEALGWSVGRDSINNICIYD